MLLGSQPLSVTFRVEPSAGAAKRILERFGGRIPVGIDTLPNGHHDLGTLEFTHVVNPMAGPDTAQLGRPWCGQHLDDGICC